MTRLEGFRILGVLCGLATAACGCGPVTCPAGMYGGAEVLVYCHGHVQAPESLTLVNATANATVSSFNELACALEHAARVVGQDMAVFVESSVVTFPRAIQVQGAHVAVLGRALDSGATPQLRGSGTSRLFWVNASVIELHGLQLSGGLHSESGGAMEIVSSDVVLKGTRFENNTVQASSALGNKGGAVYFRSSSSAANVMPKLTIQDSNFVGNSISGQGVPVFGGAVGVEVAADTAVSFEALASTFRGNSLSTSGSADSEGGAVGIRSIGSGGGSVLLSEVNFSGNSVSATRASRGGALHVDGDPTRPYNLHVLNVTFSSNTAMFGGAVSIIAGAKCEIQDTQFNSNSATQSGGALFGYQVSPWDMTRVVAHSNQAVKSGGFAKVESGSVVTFIKLDATENEAGEEGGVLAVSGGSSIDVLRSELVGNNASSGSAISVANSEWSCLYSDIAEANNMGSPLVAAVASPSAVDSCKLNSTNMALVSDDVVGLRNSQVQGGVRTSSTQGLLSCADAGGDFAALVGCAPQYCQDAPGSRIGVSCYCDTDLGPQDPTWQGCEEPPKLQVLQRSFKLYADKPDAVEATMFLTNGGDDELAWSVAVKSQEPGHAWKVSPLKGNLSTCDTANFSVSLAAANKAPFTNYELTLELSSNTYPFLVDPTFEPWNGGRKQILTTTRIPRNTTVTVAVDYFLRAEASASHSMVMLVGNMTDSSSRAAILSSLEPSLFFAGDRVEGYVEARDADNLPIIGAGADDFRVRLERANGNLPFFPGDPVICEVFFEAQVSLHKFACDANPYHSGDFQVVVTLAPSNSEVDRRNVQVVCSSGFIVAGNGTCGCSQGNHLDEVRKSCASCPAGRYGDAIATIQQPYPCQDCRLAVPGSFSVESGEMNVSGCVCPPNFFLYDRRMPDDNDDAPPVLRCEDVPDGASAPEYGTQVTDLIIEPGFWRLRDDTAAVLACADPYPCVGSNASDNLCIENAHGPYCSLCDDGYVKGLSGECIECTPGSRGAITFLAVVLCLLVLGGLGVSFKFMTRKQIKSEQLFAKLEAEMYREEDENLSKGKNHRQSMIMATDGRRSTNAALDFLTAYTAHQAMAPASGGGGSGGGNETAQRALHAVRLVAQELQFFGYIGAIFPGPMPQGVRAVLQSLAVLNLDLVAVLPLGCAVDGWNFHDKLLVTTLWPLGLLLICAGLFGIGKCSTGALRVLQATASEVALLFIFCVYTTIANVVFATWQCEEFPDSDMSRLQADYSVDCDSDEHKFYSQYATAMLFAYPLGVPIVFAIVLFLYRDRLTFKHYMRKYNIPEFNEAVHLRDSSAPPSTEVLYLLRNSDPELAPMHFLYFEYTNKCYWFECVECMRKMLMAGILTFIWPGSALQVMTGMFIALVLFGFTAYMKPHVHPSDSVISSVSQFCTFWLLFTLLIQKAATSTPSALLVPMFYCCIFLPICTGCIAIYLDVKDFLKKRRNAAELRRVAPSEEGEAPTEQLEISNTSPGESSLRVLDSSIILQAEAETVNKKPRHPALEGAAPESEDEYNSLSSVENSLSSVEI